MRCPSFKILFLFSYVIGLTSINVALFSYTTFLSSDRCLDYVQVTEPFDWKQKGPESRADEINDTGPLAPKPGRESNNCGSEGVCDSLLKAASNSKSASRLASKQQAIR
jgi:hypothetical protein